MTSPHLSSEARIYTSHAKLRVRLEPGRKEKEYSEQREFTSIGALSYSKTSLIFDDATSISGVDRKERGED